MVYDGPVPPRGIFDAFLNMSSLQLDVKERTFVDLIESTRLAIAPIVRPRSVNAFFTLRGADLIYSPEPYTMIFRPPTIPRTPSIVSLKK